MGGCTLGDVLLIDQMEEELTIGGIDLCIPYYQILSLLHQRT